MGLIVIACLIFSLFLSKILWKGFEMMFKLVFVSIVTIILSGILIYFFLLK
jgi:hypothetical protein